MLQNALLVLTAASTVAGPLGWLGDVWARGREEATRRIVPE